eukprot:CAMPEP_0194356890 /NCGR_PEP_ID=MMETSP0174-20130528/4449_1 /TAXON_ID=216777 /ORGANISM="Proboscia alata, Strain PI-D3" /LENGTH=577 /DNA_ID=CAMNT_0039126673 /DNA_START=248 /DNA_END=1981 /DNA_ORIENTATION=-
MPTSKKKQNSKKSNAERRIKRETAQSVLSSREQHVDEFRNLLLTARLEYSKGRSYDAVKLQRQALKFGSENLPRFDDNSLVKAHALLELGLALTAVCTDFAVGEEWRIANSECEECFKYATRIFEMRLVSGKAVLFRSDECWINVSGEGNSENYASPVPFIERIGPPDYISCINMSISCQDPSKTTVQALTRVISFGKYYKKNHCVIRLEGKGGFCLSGEIPIDLFDKLSVTLENHKAVLDGRMTKEEFLAQYTPKDANKPEVRHTGLRQGKMKNSGMKLAKDIEKKGLFQCANEGCHNVERQPRQFSTCSRCKWACYCSKECQSTDWKRHKKECKSGEAVKNRTVYKDQNKDESCLQYGQTQQLLTIVRYLHHFAALSEEMMSTRTTESTMLKAMVLPQLKDVEMGTIQLGLQEVSFVWNALWSMTQSDRSAMIRRFLSKEVPNFGFPPKTKGGPDFDVISVWSLKAIAGNFAVVKHTPKGSILLHDDERLSTNGNDNVVYNAYLVIGISQSIQSLLDPMNTPLPIHINTAILPFKKSVVCQGTVFQRSQSLSKSFKAIALSCTKDQAEMDVLTHL